MEERNFYVQSYIWNFPMRLERFTISLIIFIQDVALSLLIKINVILLGDENVSLLDQTSVPF